MTQIPKTITVLLIALFSCSESTEFKKHLDEDALAIVLKDLSDFRLYIETQHSNIIALASMSEDQKLELSKVYTDFSVDPLGTSDRAERFLIEIKFQSVSFIHYSRLICFLEENYSFNLEELNQICNRHFSEANIYQRPANGRNYDKLKIDLLALKCSGYCAQAAANAYPELADAEANQFNSTARSIYFAGCYHGCTNPQ